MGMLFISIPAANRSVAARAYIVTHWLDLWFGLSRLYRLAEQPGPLLELLLNLKCYWNCSTLLVWVLWNLLTLSSQLYIPHGAVCPMTDGHAGQMEKSSHWQTKWVVNGAGKGREIFKEDKVEKNIYVLREGVRFSGEILAPIPALKRRKDEEKIKKTILAKLKKRIKSNAYTETMDNYVRL